MSLTCALAICASSSRCTTWSAVSVPKVCVMTSRSASRLATRREFEEKRSSASSSGCCSTILQNLSHSRSFCSPSITVFPSPARKGPYIDRGGGSARAQRRCGALVSIVEREAHPLDHAFEHGDIDAATLARLAALQQCGQDAGVGIHASRNIGDRAASLRRSIFRSGYGKKA